MNILIFLLILSILVFVHELGHFLMAKANNIRVDTFAIGFQPTLWKKKVGETTYKINALLFGGYVSIFGENPDEESLHGPGASRSMLNKKSWQQAIVLFGGILFNMVFALLVIIVSLWIGAPTIVSPEIAEKIRDPQLTVLQVMADSPAETAGLQVGDVIVDVYSGMRFTSAMHSLEIDQVIADIQEASGDISLVVMPVDAEDGADPEVITMTPEEGLVGEEQGVGIVMEHVGILREGFLGGIVSGFKQTVALTGTVAIGLAQLISGQVSLDMVAGPVGLVSVVGDAAGMGFVSILTLTAVISINLALLNLIPFPALDGGRLLFVAIEAITRKKIKPAIANWVNAIGFGLLLLLMLVVTVKDVINLF